MAQAEGLDGVFYNGKWGMNCWETEESSDIHLDVNVFLLEKLGTKLILSNWFSESESPKESMFKGTKVEEGYLFISTSNSELFKQIEFLASLSCAADSCELKITNMKNEGPDKWTPFERVKRGGAYTPIKFSKKGITYDIGACYEREPKESEAAYKKRLQRFCPLEYKGRKVPCLAQ